MYVFKYSFQVFIFMTFTKNKNIVDIIYLFVPLIFFYYVA